MVPVLQHQCGSQGSETSPSMLLLLAQVEAQRWCWDWSDGEFMRFYPTQNLDVLGHICLGLCPDCDYTLLFWRLQIWYLCFHGTHRYILDPYYRHTHVSSPLFQAIHAQQKNMAELLGTATKTYIPCCQSGDRYLLLGDVPKPPRFTVCDGSGSLRVRFFATDGESQEWVLVILTGGFLSFDEFSLGPWVSSHLALNIGWNSFPWNPCCAIFQTPGEGNPERCQWKLGLMP